MSGSVTGNKSKNSGSQSGSFNNQFRNTPITPEGFTDAWAEFKPGAQGFTGPQQAGVDLIQGAIPGVTQGLDFAQNYFQGNRDRNSNMLSSFARDYPEIYGQQPNVQAGQVGNVADVSAKTGASFMDAYKNPFTEQVVDASLADYNVAADRAGAARRASRGAGAAFGDRAQISDAIFDADVARGAGSLGANLRYGGFNTAAGYGQQDASRDLQAGGMNQNTQLARAIQQAANDQSASVSNADILNRRQMFDVTQADVGHRMRDDVVQAGQNNAIARLNALTGAGGQLFDAGSQGQNQNLAWLTGGLPLFGEEGTEQGTANQTTRGKSSSKGGSISGGG